ncbi:TetR/AcrR family transcriptional regulator [Streptomyces atroolivaceus]|uniref:TetR/AcrR family transcriptional regulator n=1 Tax=Streptomyces atroolivaceus TaxID=66869 RepID=A0ABV9VJB8_STRAZ|nr:TetR/AcrR family transcriptional regulator [Streptomyces atroolivaceus]
MPVARSARGPYAKTAKLRARAIDAGIELFGTTGYYGATLTDVADRLGMSLTGLQHHFPDKGSLLVAVLEERDRRAAAAVPGGSQVDAVESLLGMLRESQKNPGLMELQCVLSAEATSVEHPAHDYFRHRYAVLRSQGAAAFRQLADRGELAVPIEPESLTSMLIALVDGLQLQWLLDHDSVDIEAEVRTFLRTFIPTLH